MVSLPVESDPDGEGVSRFGLNGFDSDLTSLLKKSVRKSSGLTVVVKSSEKWFRSTDSSDEQLEVSSDLMVYAWGLCIADGGQM